MSQTFTATGGARVGWTNASWPLAQLSSSQEQLILNIRLLGTYAFVPEQVSEIEKFVWLPVIAQGIKIHHCNPDCPEKIIFWSLGNPKTVLQGIKDSGFLPTALPSAIVKRRGIAIRWSVIIGAFALWNGPFFLAFFLFAKLPENAAPVALLFLLPLAMAFAFCLGTLKSPSFRRIVLKPGRSVGEIRPILRLIGFITGIMLLVFSIAMALGGFTLTNQRPSHSADLLTIPSAEGR